MGVGLVRPLQPPDILWIHWRVYNSTANTSKVLFLAPSDVCVRSFLYPFYTLINSTTQKLWGPALSLALDWILLLRRPRIPASFCGFSNKLSPTCSSWRASHRGRRQLKLTLRTKMLAVAILGNSFHHQDTGVVKCHFRILPLTSERPGLHTKQHQPWDAPGQAARWAGSPAGWGYRELPGLPANSGHDSTHYRTQDPAPSTSGLP